MKQTVIRVTSAAVAAYLAGMKWRRTQSLIIYSPLNRFMTTTSLRIGVRMFVSGQYTLGLNYTRRAIFWSNKLGDPKLLAHSLVSYTAQLSNAHRSLEASTTASMAYRALRQTDLSESNPSRLCEYYCSLYFVLRLRHRENETWLMEELRGELAMLVAEDSFAEPFRLTDQQFRIASRILSSSRAS